MKRIAGIALAVSLAITAAGCTTHLDSGQEQEFSVYESKGLVVKEKSVGVAAALGILPAAGYFYTGHPVKGVFSIPLWVISLGPLWMPLDNAQNARLINFYATRSQVERDKAKALRELDHRLEDRELTYEQHLREQRTIEAKYSAY
ncbi:hypothetical protein IYR97_24540 (plasmid) [Pseudomonas fulva]|jgi:hypothetical protein|uniref:TM2 domain-containing protein n=2 Tax=Pseudomonas putida group TaxID=136845 RepID=A0A1X0ZGR4_PSEPU|nr:MULTISPECIES: hypothetical protein [Pseudomonas]MBA6119313.1 hypothetical protein [Pseudomonas putida]MCT8162672.1 hypothetical protein [Pseudomonas sp. HD6422]MCT8181559.1 hypothetical protein [Pseudomonas sp. HD6421]MDH1932440.1 hypothetical protein [Pseudomonas sp. GD03696]ORL51957.1 hypothetical protein B7H18_07900 [Pseudomonas putida]